MERYFIFNNYNTYYDWKLLLTAKTISDAEPNEYLVTIDGMSGSLDMSEALSGEVTYQDRTITATFWTNNGTRKERERLLREITTALHGKKVKVIEPDDPYSYFMGRVKIKSKNNIFPYMEFAIEISCEPWRYALQETERRVDVSSDAPLSVILHNNGVKTLCPVITVDGIVTVEYEGVKTVLANNSYKISDIKLRQGANVIGVSGDGSVTFTYREADL